MPENQLVDQLQRRTQLLETRIRRLEQANQTLQKLCYLDGLTGIPNRRQFEDVLRVEWRRACRIGEALSVIMVDADCFKSFNDSYGHQRGDDCLMVIARALRSELKRPGDLVARYGGEEFVIILPGTDAHGAAIKAEEIRARVEALNIGHKGSCCSRVVTISLGVVTTFPTTGVSSAALITAADAALYKAKHEGRNRVIVAGRGLLPFAALDPEIVVSEIAARDPSPRIHADDRARF